MSRLAADDMLPFIMRTASLHRYARLARVKTLRRLNAGGQTTFWRVARIDDRWTIAKAVINCAVVSVAVWPIAAVRSDAALIAAPITIAIWYAAEIAVRSRNMLRPPGRRLVLTATEFTIYSTLLLYLSIRYEYAHLGLFMLYVWPLYRLASNHGFWVSTAAVTSAVVVVATASLLASQSLSDAALCVIWVITMFAALRYLGLRAQYAMNLQYHVADSMERADTTQEAFEVAGEYALKATGADIVVVFSVLEGRIAPHPNVSLSSEVRLIGSYEPVAVGDDTPVTRVRDEYLSTAWRARRQHGHRTMIHDWSSTGATDPVFGGETNSHGELSFASREQVATTAALILAPRDRYGEHIAGIAWLNWRRTARLDAFDLDHLAQLLGAELTAFRLKESSRVVRERQRLVRTMVGLHDSVKTELSKASLDLDWLLSNLPASLGTNAPDIPVESLLGEIATRIDNAKTGLGLVRSDPDNPTHLAWLKRSIEGFFDSQHYRQIMRFEGFVIDAVIPRDPAGAMTLYLLCREAIRNALVHSGSTEVICRVEIAQDNVATSFQIEDHGKGIDAEDLLSDGGMNAMRAHAREIDAALTIETSASGTTIRIALTPEGDSG